MRFAIPLLFAALLALGSHAAFAQEDLTPPALLDVQFEPQTIDTSKGPATITVTIHVTDDLSGMAHVALFFRRPGTTQHNQVEFRPDEGWSEIVTGDLLDGWHRATMTIPQYAAYGEWEMYNVSLEDTVGNWLYLSRPETPGEQKAPDNQWPALYNGFAFGVEAAQPRAPQAVYLPLLR